jgi:bifunctional DNA-binding transcriptional regulator/antitoxin component of YhaV-PrlF toxin-antitoxin module
MSEMRKNRIVVVKRGHVTVPLWLRKKYKIEDNSDFVIVEQDQGLLLKPIKSIWI